MRVSRGRIQKAETAYSLLKKKPVAITTDRTTWKVIDLKKRSCIARYPTFLAIEAFLRDQKNKNK